MRTRTAIRPARPEGGRGSPRRLFGLEISEQSEDQLLAELLAPPEAGCGPQLVATLNLDHVVNLRRNARFREAYGWAWRVTIDGAPVFGYARSRGVSAPARITGAGMFAVLARMFRPGEHRLFFCVGSPLVAEEMRAFLAERGFAEGDMHFTVPPFGFEKDAEQSAELAGAIRRFAPTHLVFALGSPKSEIWTYEHRQTLGDCRVLCVGAAVEFLVGIKTRAPRWMRDAGLEWLWRLASEPRRLFRRYCIDSLGFLAAIRSDLRTEGHSVL